MSEGIGNLVADPAGLACFFPNVFTEVGRPEHGAGFGGHQHFAFTSFQDYVKTCPDGLGNGNLPDPVEGLGCKRLQFPWKKEKHH